MIQKITLFISCVPSHGGVHSLQSQELSQCHHYSGGIKISHQSQDNNWGTAAGSTQEGHLLGTRTIFFHRTLYYYWQCLPQRVQKARTPKALSSKASSPFLLEKKTEQEKGRGKRRINSHKHTSIYQVCPWPSRWRSQEELYTSSS